MPEKPVRRVRVRLSSKARKGAMDWHKAAKAARIIRSVRFHVHNPVMQAKAKNIFNRLYKTYFAVFGRAGFSREDSGFHLSMLEVWNSIHKNNLHFFEKGGIDFLGDVIAIVEQSNNSDPSTKRGVNIQYNEKALAQMKHDSFFIARRLMNL